MNLAQCAEPYLGEALRGVVTRDWSLIGDALRHTAIKYHNENGLPLHSGLEKIDIKLSEASRAIVSAALHAAEREGKDML